MELLYYTAPPDEVFNEVKEKAIEIWKTYDNEFGYVDEKVNRIKELKNVRDNVMFIVSMLDSDNQRKLALLLSKTSRQEIRDRLISCGLEEAYYNPF